jgi:hypothetical protein
MPSPAATDSIRYRYPDPNVILRTESTVRPHGRDARRPTPDRRLPGHDLLADVHY